jgi:hypothetical protein
VRTSTRIAALVGLLAVSRAAFAQEPDTEVSRAENLFRDGAAALKRGDLLTGCNQLTRSNQLDPAIGTLGLLALCHERQGRLATAVAEYRTVASLARSANQTERASVAAAQAEQLASRVSHLGLSFTDDVHALHVELGGRQRSASELAAPLPLDPGSIDVRVTREGYESIALSVEIPSDGSTTRLIVPALKRHPVAAAPRHEAVAKHAPKPVPPSQEPALPPVTWVALGTGALGLSIGAYLGFGALASKSDAKAHCVANDCDSDGVLLRERALHQATGSTIAFAVGGAALGTALVLYLTREREAPRLSAAVEPAARGGVLTLRGRF